MISTSTSIRNLAYLRSTRPVRLISLSTCFPSRGYSDTPVPPRPRRPSPYRLVSPQSFISTFAPLHIAGWRLVPLPDSPAPVRTLDHTDLQDRRLVRLYEFEGDQSGWRDLMALAQKIGQEVEQEDHHPRILIAPAADYRATDGELAVDETTGYILELSTHTHTPLPPIGSPAVSGSKIRPGVTGKDLKLAEKVEKLYEQLSETKI